MEDIDGAKKNLADYKGKVLLIVNTASKCGYTPQYAGLEGLYQKHKSEGFEVLGFPSNDFGSQEPLNNKEIVADCQKRFGVTFPLFAKTAVKGKDANPLFVKLAKQPAPIGGEPGWNFTKFLVDRQGNVVARFDSRVKPDDVELEKRISELLKTK
ncbi:MAG: glutathione peroxidase [Planctomycetes bacterium]|nr:glutathione peroxidase [Planctomycetota bacterium]